MDSKTEVKVSEDGEEKKSFGRSFSEVMRKTGESFKNVEYTVEDISDLMDMAKNLEDALHREEEMPAGGKEEGKVMEEEKQEEIVDFDLRKVEKSVMKRDTIAFFLGVVNVALIGFWMGKSPETYYHYWAFKSLVLFSWRWYTYRQKGWQYLMFELCYFGNFLGMIHVYFFPRVMLMRKLSFAVCAGPLMWSIMAMRNSLVFHDVDKITTLMMHASPALTAWSLRWYPDERWYDGYKGDDAMYSQSTWKEFVGYPVAFYISWVVLYYCLCFVLLKQRIERKGGVTMFDLMVPKDTEKARKNTFLRIITSAPEAWQPIVYLCCHGVAATVSFLPTYFFWKSFILHTATLLFCLSLSIWNGGTFYFKVFAKKYSKDLQERSIHRRRKKIQ